MMIKMEYKIIQNDNADIYVKENEDFSVCKEIFIEQSENCLYVSKENIDEFVTAILKIQAQISLQ